MSKLVSKELLDGAKKKYCLEEKQMLKLKELYLCEYVEGQTTGIGKIILLFKLLNKKFPEKYIDKYQIQTICHISIKKIAQYIPEYRDYLLTTGNDLANKFGAGWKIANSREASQEVRKKIKAGIGYIKNAEKRVNLMTYSKKGLGPNERLATITAETVITMMSGAVTLYDQAMKNLDKELKGIKELDEQDKKAVTRPVFKEGK